MLPVTTTVNMNSTTVHVLDDDCNLQEVRDIWKEIYESLEKEMDKQRMHELKRWEHEEKLKQHEQTMKEQEQQIKLRELEIQRKRKIPKRWQRFC